jgi:uncharacterized Zn finger protein
MHWYYEKRKKPKAAPGATRKNYGVTWWGKQWLQVFENIDFNNRLPRGKTYANNGLVYDLAIKGNTITAKVEGSMNKPYKVTIQVPAFTKVAQSNLIRSITDNPLFLAKLLNREIPPELNDACEQQNIHIFPKSWHEMNGSCSCYDWAIPCKHMAAVVFLVANEIDKNPFVVFDLHDFNLVQALEKNGYTQESDVDSSQIVKLGDLQQPLSALKPSFLFADQALLALDFSLIPACSDNLLLLLSEKPVFYPEGDFKKILAGVYKKAASTPSPKVFLPSPPDLLRSTEHVMLVLDATDNTFMGASFLNTADESVHDFESLDDLCGFLQSLSAVQLEQAPPALRSLQLAYNLSAHLVQKGAFVPQIISANTYSKTSQDAFFIRFIPALHNEEVRAVFRQTELLFPTGILLYVDVKQTCEPVPSDYATALVSLFINHFVCDAAKTETMEIPKWFFSGQPSVFYRFENQAYPKSVQLWLSRFFITEKKFVPVFEVHDDGEEFELTVGIEDKSSAFETPIPLAELFSNKKHARLRLDTLRDLSMVASFFPPLNNLIASQGKQRLLYNEQTFVEVFYKALPIIRLFGIRVLLPKALQKIFRPATSMFLNAHETNIVQGNSLLSLSNLLDFQWEIALGDQLYTPDEFSKMVKKMRGIVRLTDGYAFIDEKEMSALLDNMQKLAAPSGPKLLQIALSGEYQGAPVKLNESARKLMHTLMQPNAVTLPKGLNATLRPYQLRGYEWLYKNTKLGIGSLLADDMGLGKTIQVLATLLRLKEDGALSSNKKALVVAPTTLLTNWQKEAERFTPSLKTHIYHGLGRSLKPLEQADVLLTTYGVVRSASSDFQKIEWLITVIDEAQNIKNIETAQTKAVKKLKSSVNIAMSGTPVENRLSEYYSVLEFANRGYLGSVKEFTDTFARPIEVDRNQAVLHRFQRITAPFLLRRLKTDKSIISDLPDKIETNQFCTLTLEQAGLYQNIVADSLNAIGEAHEDGIQRQGLVLKMITSLKQVCNHPAQFLKRKDADPELSGKTQLLLEILTQILERGEKTLVFTQYQAMGDLLIPILEKELGEKPAFLHGGVSRKERDNMVHDFQHNRNTKILLLSLKAGGTGLNLTEASNVIHYDLWWNPAVEAQATDRAFRIGQQRNVQVHRFISQGTFEEKIDVMLQTKKELANLAVASGEKWIGELSTAELRELVAFG